ncbi:MAG: hypothetical protein IPO32_00750 [Crocinitomicaceae bacterium]|nr:hypothetical protein [Crocinitomicaceae bacterium]
MFSNNSGTVLSITGDLDITNNASATTSNVYIGNQGAVNVSGQTTAVNNASGTSGEIYVASGGNSTVTFAVQPILQTVIQEQLNAFGLAMTGMLFSTVS